MGTYFYVSLPEACKKHDEAQKREATSTNPSEVAVKRS
ncbi:hypothetical protein [Atlantibacter hermannii]